MIRKDKILYDSMKPIIPEMGKAPLFGGASQPLTKALGGSALAVLDKPWGRSYL